MEIDQEQELLIVSTSRIFFNQSKSIRFRKDKNQQRDFHFREVHIDSPIDEEYSQSSSRQSPFRDDISNGRLVLSLFYLNSTSKFIHSDRTNSNTDWLEKSIKQISLFSRRHRGMVESIFQTYKRDIFSSIIHSFFTDEPIDEYFSSNNSSKYENDYDEEQ